jgi:hypothetical protein
MSTRASGIAVCGFVRAGAVATLLMVTVTGCMAPPLTKAELENGPLSFIRDGSTTREEVILHLGPPSAEFEGNRILTYRISHDPAATAGLSVSGGEQYHLILVFDTRNVLTKHSLVPVGHTHTLR